MIDYPHRYNEKEKAIDIFFDFNEHSMRVPADVVKKWNKHLQEHKTPCGRELKAVHFIFPCQTCAKNNQQALEFAQIVTCVGNLEDHEPLKGDKPSFGTREDFGVGSGGMNQVVDDTK